MDDLVDYVGAYLIGCIPTGLLLIKFFKRKSGQKKAITPWGLLKLALDFLKGAVAVSLAHLLSPKDPPDMVFAGFLVLMGDEFPIFLKFKGNRGIGATLGVFGTLLAWMLT
jgi:glycerol-3-phosphate acyltransferase PlsY